jgi:hypothetical protein
MLLVGMGTPTASSTVSTALAGAGVAVMPADWRKDAATLLRGYL